MTSGNFLNKLVLNINSAERISGSSTDFIVNPNLNNFTGVKSVGLLSAEIPNSVYNVSLTQTNFKIRLVRVRNTGQSPNNINPPQTYLFDVYIPSKNYTATNLAQAIQAAVNNQFDDSSFQSTFGGQYPVLFSIDPDTFKFQIQINQSIPNYNQWGFVLIKTNLATDILGFSGLNTDVELLNINNTNNVLQLGVFSNVVGQQGDYKQNLLVTVNDTNKFLEISATRTNNQNQTSTYNLSMVLFTGTFNRETFLTMVNAKIVEQESLINAITSFPATFNQGTIYQGLPNGLSIRLIFRNGGWSFINADEQNNPLIFLLGLKSKALLATLASLWDNQNINIAVAIFAVRAVFHVSNKIAFLKSFASYQIPNGYWSADAFYDVLPSILYNLTNSNNLVYNLQQKKLISTLGVQNNDTGYDKVAFDLGSTAASLLSVKTVDFSNPLVCNVDSPFITTSLDASINVPFLPVYNAQVSSTLINLRAADTLFIHSSIQGSVTCDGYGNASRCLSKIPMSAPLGYTVFWTNYDHEMYRYPCSLVNMISFSLRDKGGKVVDLGGLDWSLTLVFYFDT